MAAAAGTTAAVVLPIRLQCPLCFDVLRRPIQLPCCQRHLCTECFERALELTSVNCGFCRKRLVGFARKKQYKVDDGLWAEIQRLCPLVAIEEGNDGNGNGNDGNGNGNGGAAVEIEFVDENAPRPHRHDAGVGVGASDEIEMIDKPLTIDVDLDATQLMAATASPPRATMMSDDESPSTAMTTRHKQQQRLDAFFAMPTPTEDPSANDTSHRVHTRGRSRRPAVGVGKKNTHAPTTNSTIAPRVPLLRSASHSPKRRKPQTVQKTLFGLTLHSPPAAGGLSTSSRWMRSADKGPHNKGDKSRRSWRCAHCTFENTCFDTQCSMCRQVPS